MAENQKLVALRLFLKALDQPEVIETVENRKQLQKAVYLGQAAGADLGYRFSWYVMGPYSSQLTEDYYAFEQTATALPEGVELIPTYAERLAKVRAALRKPPTFTRIDADWLELLASYHFLRKASGLDHVSAKQRISEQKNHLSDYVELAKETLNSCDLLAVGN